MLNYVELLSFDLRKLEIGVDREHKSVGARVGSFICQFHEVESIHGIEDNCETNSSPLSEA